MTKQKGLVFTKLPKKSGWLYKLGSDSLEWIKNHHSESGFGIHHKICIDWVSLLSYQDMTLMQLKILVLPDHLNNQPIESFNICYHHISFQLPLGSSVIGAQG